ncbi:MULTISPECIES: thiol reductant ABC exporter subunit CydC [Nonomuraea]|uniref:Thiol reductant ABC exporter subunit CydC n=1 Tax=Nonomuraea ferruginea TaxID=46174 RepID=A0ABT4T8K7_9ACTN|nr:thiol reductant ABC exporter subunit CydC [Nonomuraea ferruginea]MDA0645841.1 thiol reductant ABC exporter subunit CydC [Nonomuraea ferruginea]
MTRIQISRRLLAFGRPLLVPLAVSVLFRVLQQCLGIALYGVGAWGVVRVVSGEPEVIGEIAVAMVVMAFAKGLFRYVEQYSGHFVAFKLLALLRDDFYERIEPQAPAGTEGGRSGDLLARVMKDIDRIEVFYAHTIAPALAAAVVPVISLTVLGTVFSPVVALVLAPFLIGVGIGVPWLSHRAAATAATELRRSRGEVSQHLTDGVQGIREVLAFGYGPRRLAELGALGGAGASAVGRLGRLIALRRGLNELLVAAGMIAVLFTGHAQGLGWQDIAITVAIGLAAFGPVLGVEEFVADLEQAFAAARRLWEITDRPPLVVDPGSPEPRPAGRSIAFESVTFTYPGGPAPALQDVSFTVPEGERYAVVGASGSGKSTLVSLLLRFWDPDSGRVRVGGVPVDRLGLGDLRDLVAVVGQRTYLFNDTVAANLRLARPAATQDELEAACRRAALHDTITAMPEGYDTVIGEMGERLSGGQRQRLAIARALLKDAPIIVLDEATSELDTHTEAEIQRQIDDLAEGRTLLVIAHRLATVTGAGRILVLDRGRLVEQGTHEELLARQDAYARLYARQADDLDRAAG